MSEFAYFELRRRSDDLVYQFDRSTAPNGTAGYRRRDRDLWIVFEDRLGWVAVDDAVGSVTGRPWNVKPEDQTSDRPPEGDWVSKKGVKSYVYLFVYGTPLSRTVESNEGPAESQPSSADMPADRARPTRVSIRPLRSDDQTDWIRMRHALWPEPPLSELIEDIGDYLGRRSDMAALVAESVEGKLIGFIELSLRSTAEACTTHPVGFIESWYVDPDVRRSGVGRALVAAGENWARERGCTEMGSNAELDNRLSHIAHGQLGYEEVDRLVHFRKSLAAE